MVNRYPHQDLQSLHDGKGGVAGGDKGFAATGIGEGHRNGSTARIRRSGTVVGQYTPASAAG